jgi:altronate dehydratase small subunit
LYSSGGGIYLNGEAAVVIDEKREGKEYLLYLVDLVNGKSICLARDWRDNLKIDALRMNDKDNVATALRTIRKGKKITLKNGDDVTLLDDIPFGHKFACVSIKKGGDIIKYGEKIGRATASIKKGAYVHVHNVESLRGRGDLS